MKTKELILKILKNHGIKAYYSWASELYYLKDSTGKSVALTEEKILKILLKNCNRIFK